MGGPCSTEVPGLDVKRFVSAAEFDQKGVHEMVKNAFHGPGHMYQDGTLRIWE